MKRILLLLLPCLVWASAADLGPFRAELKALLPPNPKAGVAIGHFTADSETVTETVVFVGNPAFDRETLFEYGSVTKVRLEDVETLNQLARQGTLPVTKISYHAFFHLTERYVMLRAGGALGFGVGPLIVTKGPLGSLSGKKVAIPGGLTTANLLLKLSQPDDIELLTLRYDRVMPAVAAGEADAGLIIHESRFTYPEYGLTRHLDLGAWWEGETGLPLPLGGIMAERSLGAETLAKLDDAVRASLRYGYAHRAEAQPYIAAHAQEMSETVMQRHIDLYVNELSVDVGEEGERAVRELYRRARECGLVPEVREPLFSV